jgi:hypothetical protein
MSSPREVLTAAASCLDDLASGTLGPEDTLREQIAARAHVERLHRLAEVLPAMSGAELADVLK